MMRMRRYDVVVMLATLALFTARSAAFEIAVVLDEPIAPPDWVLLERELLRAQTSACQEFFAKYFDELTTGS